jgi:hypothetical protein
VVRSIKIFRMVTCLAVPFLTFSASPVFGQTGNVQMFPTTQEGFYAAAQNFANCSGHLTFVASLAKRFERNDAATAFEDLARGWEVAGMFLLAESMSSERETETEETFKYMVASKVTFMKAQYEADPVGSLKDFNNDFEKNCKPLAETQKKIIELMRRG